jgi:hypothetical protein
LVSTRAFRVEKVVLSGRVRWSAGGSQEAVTVAEQTSVDIPEQI